MLTEREIRLITHYADMIRDEALGLAAQHAVSDYGTDADRANPSIQTVLRGFCRNFHLRPFEV